jgi:hypothetical protein
MGRPGLYHSRSRLAASPTWSTTSIRRSMNHFSSASEIPILQNLSCPVLCWHSGSRSILEGCSRGNCIRVTDRGAWVDQVSRKLWGAPSGCARVKWFLGELRAWRIFRIKSQQWWTSRAVHLSRFPPATSLRISIPHCIVVIGLTELIATEYERWQQ